MNSFELRIYIPDVFLNPFSQFTKTAIYAIYNTIELFTLLTLLLLYKTAASYTTYNTIQYNTKQLLTLRLLTPPGPGGVRPYMGNIGMYGPKVWFFSRFGHKLGIDFWTLVLYSVFLEEATSSSRPPSPIRALPSSNPLNA